MKTIILLMAILVPFNMYASAQDIESLRGIQEFDVSVDILGDAENILPKNTLQAFVEMRLREVGIKISNSRKPTKLMLIINTLKTRTSSLYAISVILRVAQEVTLARSPDMKSFGTTWEISNMLILSEYGLNNIRDDLQSTMDYFISDFLKVNPRKFLQY